MGLNGREQVKAVDTNELKRSLLIITSYNVEKTTVGFTQQPVVMKYMLAQLMEKVAADIETEIPSLLAVYTLTQFQTQDYIRPLQARLILQPLANIVVENYRRCGQCQTYE